MKYLNLRINLFTYFLSQFCQLLICPKRENIHLRNLSFWISKAYRIYIMMYQITGNNQISDIDLCLQGACNSCVNDSLYIKHIHQDLCADCSIDFSDTTAYDNHSLAFKNTFTKFHTGFFYQTFGLHLLFQFLNLNFHCSYNPYCTHCLSPSIIIQECLSYCFCLTLLFLP